MILFNVATPGSLHADCLWTVQRKILLYYVYSFSTCCLYITRVSSLLPCSPLRIPHSRAARSNVSFSTFLDILYFSRRSTLFRVYLSSLLTTPPPPPSPPWLNPRKMWSRSYSIQDRQLTSGQMEKELSLAPVVQCTTFRLTSSHA